MSTKQIKPEDIKPLAVDPHEMFPQVKLMLHKQAWSFSRTFPVTVEEATAEAYFGFMVACQKYDTESKMKFSTWCYRMVWWTLKNMAMYRASRNSMEQSVGLFAEELDLPDDNPSPEFLDRMNEECFWLSDDVRQLLEMILTPPEDVLQGKRPTPKQLVSRIRRLKFNEPAARAGFDGMLNELRDELAPLVA